LLEFDFRIRKFVYFLKCTFPPILCPFGYVSKAAELNLYVDLEWAHSLKSIGKFYFFNFKFLYPIISRLIDPLPDALLSLYSFELSRKVGTLTRSIQVIESNFL